jgi:Na+-driven multidrug efflux pump
MPISIMGAYYFNYGMNGIWAGPTVAIIFNFTFFYIFIVKSNWPKIMEEAKIKRIAAKK